MPLKSRKTKKVRPNKTSASKSNKYVYAVGRRRTASARVRLFRGKGKIVINDRLIEEYFPGDISKVAYNRPFAVTDTLGKFDATIKVVGSGRQGQIDAVSHGLARALDKENHDLYHTPLKKAKLLTRDPRAKERRKVGLGGKARRKKQSPKR